MKRITAAFLAAVFVFSLGACSKDRSSWFDGLSAAEKKEFESGEIPEERIANLKKGIAEYSREVERTVKASKQIGIYYRMLALEYMSLEMYGQALDSISSAVEYFPTSPLLYYYGAVCSAQMSKTVFDREEQAGYLRTAEGYYLRTLTLNPDYNEALYGLSVLYIFEMDRPLDAERYLERLTARSSRNTDAMFLLARVKILKGDAESAIELYDKIADTAADKDVVRKAEENKKALIGGFYGG